MDLLRSIETVAVQLRDLNPRVETELDGMAALFALPIERPLYKPPTAADIDSDLAEAAADPADAGALFAQAYVDRERISDAVRSALAERDQVDLATLLEAQPLQQGLAELVAYFAMNEPGVAVDVNESARAEVSWEGSDGARRTADVPRVIYVRANDESPAS